MVHLSRGFPEVNVYRFFPPVADNTVSALSKINDLAAVMVLKTVVKRIPVPGEASRVRFFINKEPAAAPVRVEGIMLAAGIDLNINSLPVASIGVGGRNRLRNLYVKSYSC